MPLPDKFSTFEHLQDTIRAVHNRLVREEFSDVGDDNWELDVSTSRGSLRTACTIQDNDTAEMIQMRYNLFYFDLRKARDLQAPIYGTPIYSDQAIRKFKPQIVLEFLEDYADVEDGYDRIPGQIAYRLMNETNESITKASLIQIARKIKTEFAASKGYIWKKGKDMASYIDRENGYQFQLLVRNKSDAKELVTKLLDTNNHTPKWKCFHYKENEDPTDAYPTIPPPMTVLGKRQREPRYRPIADVRFQVAYCHLWGRGEPVILCDRLGYHPKALID